MRKIMKYVLLLSSVALILSGCATMNKSECLTANWKNIGYGDGAQGHTAARISEHTSACAEHGISPDLNAYNTGRTQGLAQYCIPSKGYQKGLYGSSYNGVCTNHNEKAFLDAFDYGLSIHKQQQILTNLKRNYDSEKNQIQNLNHQLSHNERRITKGHLSELQVYKLLQENKRLTADISHSQHNLGPLLDSISQQRMYINELKSKRHY